MEQVFVVNGRDLQPLTKRTNSLGTSKTPCHRCKGGKHLCDRQRPKCGTCLEDGLDCGYTLGIRWVTANNKKNSSKKSARNSRRQVVHVAPSPPCPVQDEAELELLAYYFDCVTPVPSSKTQYCLNPLRLIIPLLGKSDSLRSAVISLAATHRRRSVVEWLGYKDKALRLFHSAFDRFDDVLRLSTILVLLFAQGAESGRGSWRIHLTAVQSILDRMCQGRTPEALLSEDLLRATVLQFFWWDTIGALLSLQKPVLSPVYLRACISMNQQKEKSEWESFMVNSMGCTADMFLMLHKLATGDVCDTQPILEMNEPNLENLCKNASIDEAIDRLHTDQIWKHGAALYVLTRYNIQIPSRMRLYVRQVFDHVQALRLISPLRKQVLFPLIIAGSCTDVAEERDIIREYCIMNYRETRFELFTSGLGISEAVWMLRDEEVAEDGEGTSCWKVITGTEESSHDMLG